ncbi:MAG: ABC transporter ATP-binding protein [Nocardioides sp.]
MSGLTLPIATPRESARHLSQLLRPRRVLAVVVVVVFLAEAALGLVAPWVLGRLVDAILAGDDVVWSSFAQIAVAGAAAALLSVMAVGLLAGLSEPTLADLREQVVARALGLEHRRLEEAGAGDVLSRVGDDARVVSTNASTIVPELLASLTAVLLTVVGLFVLDWRLALAGLLALPSYVLGLRWYLPRSGPYYTRERAAMGQRAQALLGVVQGLPTLRAFRVEAPAVAEVDRRSRETLEISISVFHLFGRFASRANRSELIGLLALLVVGFLLVDARSVSVGDVTTAALFFHRLFNPIGALMFLFDEVQSTLASFNRMVGVATMPQPAEVHATPADDTLRAHGVGHAYVAGRPVVIDVDLDLTPRRRVALVGASGAGKTTVAAVVAGTMPPSSGQVTLGGVDLYTVAHDDLRHRICIVSQEVHVFAATLRDNLTLAAVPDTIDDADVVGALDEVGARWFADLADGLDTRVGDDGRSLTAFQAQQLALARVLLVDPAVVVLDEATAEAGSFGARELDRAADAVVAGRAAVVVAHRLSQARDADEILVMEHGRVVERGPHEVLVALGGRYAELWSAWGAG